MLFNFFNDNKDEIKKNLMHCDKIFTILANEKRNAA